MYLVAIGWLYVTLMMAVAVAEAAAPNGTLLGALFTFLLYGALPMALGLYLVGTPGRRRARRERELAARAASAQPDGRGEAAAGAAVPPVRKEP